MMISPSEGDTGEMKINGYQPSDRNGRSFLGWTLASEDDGKYLNGKDLVPGTDTGWVMLYAQWTPEGQTAVYLSGKFYGLANAGTTYMLPAAGNDNTIVTGWQEVTCDTENSSEQLPVTQTTDGGCQVDIPANASKLWLFPEYQYVGAAVIDGKTYQFTENETFFSGDGWQLQSLYGGVQLRLNGYHGGAIDLPYTDLVTVTVSLYGDNSITGGADAPALYSAGNLRFDSRCEANQHTSLTVTAGSGQCAVSAKRLGLAAHITLTGGEGAMAVNAEAEVVSSFMYCMCTKDGVVLTDERYNRVQCLNVEPTYATVTLNGNGGVTTNDETVLKGLRYEIGSNVPNLGKIFTKSRCQYVGAEILQGNRNQKVIYGDCTINAVWADTGYDRFVSFYMDGPIKEKLDYDFGWGAGYLFRDNSKTVIAPTITYQDPVSNGNLVYWYVSDDGEGSANAKQYRPGDVVKEESGTELYPAVVYANWNAAFMSNGKVFKDGKLAIIANQCPAEMKAADGTELIGWNTKKDGSGQAYAPGSKPDLTGRTEPLVLYAQWKKPVYVAKVARRSTAQSRRDWISRAAR